MAPDMLNSGPLLFSTYSKPENIREADNLYASEVIKKKRGGGEMQKFSFLIFITFSETYISLFSLYEDVIKMQQAKLDLKSETFNAFLSLK